MVNPRPLEPGHYRRRSLTLVRPPSVDIRALGTEHIPAFRALRLDALRKHPEAFVPTWEEERAVEPAAVASRYRNEWISDGNFILGAFVRGRLVGAIGVRRWTREKQRHRASIWLLYTDASVRGMGIGRSLLDAAIAACRRMDGVEMVHLSVSTESTSARRLYEEAGFRCYGIEPRAIRLEDRSIDVALMALDLEIETTTHA